MRPVIEHLTARVDARIEAVLGDISPLHYADAGSVADDRPAHVRAASAVRQWGARLVIVQDDVNVLALHAAGTGTGALLLPAGAGGRRVFGDDLGNKHAKMDLEACVTLPDGRLVALGSGSTAARERLVVVDATGDVRTVDGSDCYARLRAEAAFAGSELNIEGALVVGDVLRLFQRGNGAPSATRAPVNATGDLPMEAFLRWLDHGGPAAALIRVRRYDLGRIGAARLGFTDATRMADGRVAFLACAEDSPDAVRDGAVLGCRFGLIDGDDVRMADITDAAGHPCGLKLEGIERRAGAPAVFDVVADMDRLTEPALLGQLQVSGPGV